MAKATDAEIFQAVQNTYRGEFTLMVFESITTGKADKYGAVRHTVFAITTWNDGSETHNAFTINEQDGQLY